MIQCVGACDMKKIRAIAGLLVGITLGIALGMLDWQNRAEKSNLIRRYL